MGWTRARDTAMWPPAGFAPVPPLSSAPGSENRLMTYCLPTLVSVRNFTLMPCAARCRVRGVLSRIPLKSLGENTSNGSDTTLAASTIPSLQVYQHGRNDESRVAPTSKSRKG